MPALSRKCAFCHRQAVMRVDGVYQCHSLRCGAVDTPTVERNCMRCTKTFRTTRQGPRHCKRCRDWLKTQDELGLFYA